MRTKARYFVGYYTVVAEKGELTITDKDLDALAALASKPIFEMEQLLKQARAAAGE